MRGLFWQLETLLESVMRLAADSMQAESDSGAPRTSMHDLLAAVSLEVVAVSISQPLILPLYGARYSSGSNSDGAIRGLKATFQGLISAAIQRTSSMGSISPHPRLQDAIRQLYGALQRHSDHLLVQALQSHASNEEAISSVNHHMACVLRATRPSVLAPLRRLPRVGAAAVVSRLSYPVLPTSQSFDEVCENTPLHSDNAAASNGTDHVLLLPEAPQKLLTERSAQVGSATVGHGPGMACAVRLGRGADGSQLVALEPVAQGDLIAEVCGEIVQGYDESTLGLAKYRSFWPPQLCMLRMGNSSLALDISRASSLARFAEHTSVRPSCELQAHRTLSASGEWQPRMFIIATRPIEPGMPITIDYTAASIGRRESHMQADWMLALRATSVGAPTGVSSRKASGISQVAVMQSRMGATKRGTFSISAIAALRVKERHAAAIAALNKLRNAPIDDLRERQRQKVRDAAAESTTALDLDPAGRGKLQRTRLSAYDVMHAAKPGARRRGKPLFPGAAGVSNGWAPVEMPLDGGTVERPSIDGSSQPPGLLSPQEDRAPSRPDVWAPKQAVRGDDTLSEQPFESEDVDMASHPTTHLVVDSDTQCPLAPEHGASAIDSSLLASSASSLSSTRTMLTEATDISPLA